MDNIAIYIYDFSLLGGCQKVTANLTKLFHKQSFPIKAVISYEVKGDVDYDYPTDIELINARHNIKFIKEWLIHHKIKNLIVQVENLPLCNKIINCIEETGINIMPVLHNTPFYWLRKYYSLRQYLESPRFIAQYIKMKLYWHNLHMSIFHKLATKCIICVSKQAKEEMCKILGENYANNIHYIYNTLDIETTKNSTKKNITTYVGRLSVEKRPILMLKVWEKIAANNRNWIFRIIGDGPAKQEMEHYCIRKGLSNVVFTGKINNVNTYLAESKISILFSKYEGLPTGILESCACSNALVGCYNDGGLSDIIENGVNGYIVDANANQLAFAILQIMNNPPLFERMSANNKQVMEKFTNKEIINSWLALLK